MASMSQIKMHIFSIVLLVLLAIVGATPPGIANHPSHASCKIKKYKYYCNLKHVCPKFCPSCEYIIDCVFCKLVCLDETSAHFPTPTISPPITDYRNSFISFTLPTTYTHSSYSTTPTTYTPPFSSTPTTTNTHPSSSTPLTTDTPPSSLIGSQNPTPYTLPKTAKCKNKNYLQCYNMKHACPSFCLDGSEVNYVT
ncbi:hypothetical protein REPUB_Repub01dG0191100 [Reevesia pubescens]